MILDIAHKVRSEALFTNEIRCPIAAPDLASAIVELLKLPVSGVLNVVGADTSAATSSVCSSADGIEIAPDCIPAASLAATGLHRPADVRLDISRARQLLTTRRPAAPVPGC